MSAMNTPSRPADAEPAHDGPGLAADPVIQNAAAALRLLADPTRLAILTTLADGPRAVGAIAAVVDKAGPAVSQHLAKLRAGGLVTTRREGTTVIYEITNEHVGALVENVVHHTEHLLYRLPPHHR